MYELILFDKGYTFEKRWVFSRRLTISEMLKVVKSSFDNIRYVNNELIGDEHLEEFSCTISPLVYLDFYRLEFDDYILEKDNV